jgi:branched-chain amino acid transport system substrate-binding protein
MVSLRTFWIVASLLLLAGCGEKSPPPPIYFGHIAPRSGAQREVGLGAANAILLAAEEVRATDGQVLGRPIAVVHPDSQGDVEAVQSEAVRLATVGNVVGLIGGHEPLAAERLARVAQQYKLPVITPTWLPVQSLGSYAFTLGAPPTDQGTLLGNFAVKTLGAKRLAVLTDNRSAAGIVAATAFVAAAGKQQVVFAEEFAASDRLAELARQAVATGPDLVLFAGDSADLERVRLQLGQAGLAAQTPLLFGGTEAPALTALADSAGDASIYWTTLFVADGSQPQAQEFARKYEQRFGKPPDAGAALAHDAVLLFSEAIRRAKSAEGDKLREALAGIQDFQGLTGTIRWEKNQAVGRPLYVVHRQDRQLKVVRGAGEAGKR